MPPVIAAAIAAVAVGLAATSTIAGVLLGIAVFALGVVSHLLAPNVGSFEQRLQGLLTTQRQAISYGRRLFGFVRVGGVYTFIESTNNGNIDNGYLHIVLTVSWHRINDFITVYFDDYPIHIRHLDDDGFVQYGRYADLVRIQYDPGFAPINGQVTADGLFGRSSSAVDESDYQPFPDLQSEAPSWTINHKQMTRAKLYLRLEYDQEIFASGIPNITIIVKGNNYIDPRDGSQSWRPNPANYIYSLIRFNPVSLCGLGALADELDSDTFTAGANYFEERVPVNTLDPDDVTVPGQDNNILRRTKMLNVFATSTNTEADGDGKYRYFPGLPGFNLTSGQVIRIKGGDFQTGDGVQIATSASTLPDGLAYSTKYYLIIKSFGVAPNVNADELTDAGTGIAKAKELWEFGLATTYDNAINDVPIESTTLGNSRFNLVKLDEARYQCSGVWEYDRPIQDILIELLDSCASRLTYASGVFKLVGFNYVSPEWEFSQDDLISSGSLKIIPKVSRRDRFNLVTGIYSSPINAYQPSAYPKVYRDIYVTNDVPDGENPGPYRVPKSIDFPFINSPSGAQRLARIALEKARQEIMVELKVGLSGFLVTVGDNIMLTIGDAGFDRKEFEVQEWEIVSETDENDAPVLAVRLLVKEHASMIFDWDETVDETLWPDDFADNTNLPLWYVVKPPSNLETSEELYQINSGVGVAARVTLTWDTANEPFFDHYEVQYKKSEASEYESFNTGTLTFVLNGVEPDTYDFRVRTWNSLTFSAWLTLSNVEIAGLSTPPSTPTGFSVVQISDTSAIATWDATPDLDVEFGGHFILRHDEDEFSGDLVNSVTISPPPTITPKPKHLPGNSTSTTVASKDGTYLLQAVDSSGNYSPAAAAFSYTRGDMMTFTPVTTITESPSFSGTKTRLIVDSGELQLDYDTSVSPSSDVYGDGIYEFATSWSSVTERHVRITTFIDVIIVDHTDNIDDRTEPMDTWPTFDGVIGQEADARVQMRVKRGDPGSSPTPDWSTWFNVDCGFFNIHEAEFRLFVTSDFGYANIKITGLQVIIEEV